MSQKRLLRITTVPLSLVTLLDGQLKFFKENDFDVWAVSADGAEVLQLKAIGVKHVAINMTRKITPIQDVVALVQLIILMLKFKPHIVHTHTPKAGLLGMWAAWFCRVPVRMHTIAGLTWMESTGFKRWLLKLMESLTYTVANKVYPNSVNLRQFLLKELRFNPDKTTVLARGSSNGINTNQFKRTPELVRAAQAIRKQYAIPDQDLIFSFVGRVVKDKGIVELVYAFEKISQQQPAWLLIVGQAEPDLDPIPAKTWQFIQSNKNIIMTGFQSDVRPWMLASDVFVLPSHREGFPNVVMQAACLQVPVIATDINGCNEIIEHNKRGLLVPSKDTGALYRAMVSMAEDSHRRIAFGERAGAFVIENFDQQVVWKELLKEYERSLKYSPQAQSQEVK